jgi:hypothetical protein
MLKQQCTLLNAMICAAGLHHTFGLSNAGFGSGKMAHHHFVCAAAQPGMSAADATLLLPLLLLCMCMCRRVLCSHG